MIIIYPALISEESGSYAITSEEALDWINSERDYAADCDAEFKVCFCDSKVDLSDQDIKTTLESGGTVYIERDGQRWFNIEPIVEF